MQSFNWADEFLGENEDDITGGASVESGNLATSDSHSSVVLSQNYANVTTSIPTLPLTVAAPAASAAAVSSSSFLYANTLTTDPASSTATGANMLGPAIVNPLQSVTQG